MRAITIRLTDADHARLEALAGLEVRSVAQQAQYLILGGLSADSSLLPNECTNRSAGQQSGTRSRRSA
jgi:hypothetical protein